MCMEFTAFPDLHDPGFYCDSVNSCYNYYSLDFSSVWPPLLLWVDYLSACNHSLLLLLVLQLHLHDAAVESEKATAKSTNEIYSFEDSWSASMTAVGRCPYFCLLLVGIFSAMHRVEVVIGTVLR